MKTGGREFASERLVCNIDELRALVSANTKSIGGLNKRINELIDFNSQVRIVSDVKDFLDGIEAELLNFDGSYAKLAAYAQEEARKQPEKEEEDRKEAELQNELKRRLLNLQGRVEKLEQESSLTNKLPEFDVFDTVYIDARTHDEGEQLRELQDSLMKLQSGENIGLLHTRVMMQFDEIKRELNEFVTKDEQQMTIQGLYRRIAALQRGRLG